MTKLPWQPIAADGPTGTLGPRLGIRGSVVVTAGAAADGPLFEDVGDASSVGRTAAAAARCELFEARGAAVSAPMIINKFRRIPTIFTAPKNAMLYHPIAADFSGLA